MVAALRILVVDDFEPWRRFLLKFVHENLAWETVYEADNGQDAVEKCRQFQPDLILLDIGLPKLNGLEAAREIRKIVPGARILFVSENFSPDIVSAAFDAGGQGYVVKSDAACDLMTAIEAVISNRRFVGNRFKADNLPTGN